MRPLCENVPISLSNPSTDADTPSDAIVATSFGVALNNNVIQDVLLVPLSVICGYILRLIEVEIADTINCEGDSRV